MWRSSGGRGTTRVGHVRGAVFADLLGDLSDQDAPTPLMMPSPERFAEVVGQLGIGDGRRVVAYDARESMWAARLWWMLQVFGHREAAVLDGGWTAWVDEGRPVSTVTRAPQTTTFTPRPQRELREMFGAALEAGSVVTYCGGGVAASSDAFVLRLLGHEHVAVYDGSMMEWAADPDLPLVTGEE